MRARTIIAYQPADRAFVAPTIEEAVAGLGLAGRRVGPQPGDERGTQRGGRFHCDDG
ncbi:hypothetical protein ACWD33_18745 [Streptomyces xiamenensis]|uniref:Uncharacterized protein n=1 Tax=Streptomyces xiamenensis TaxID=408015 RepID=A0A0F7CMR8_9ACTN|nr:MULTISPECIES: hypothetical protein [Streptomyces]AKG41636.1 hypothetical protein SXIM_02520 [Streptomyces xiamenensis]